MSDGKGRLKGIVEDLRRYLEWQGYDDTMDVIPASEEAKAAFARRQKRRREARTDRIKSSFQTGTDDAGQQAPPEQTSPAQPSSDGQSSTQQTPSGGADSGEGSPTSRFKAQESDQKKNDETPEKDSSSSGHWNELGSLRAGSSSSKKKQSSQGQGNAGQQQSNRQDRRPQQGPPPPQPGPPPREGPPAQYGPAPGQQGPPQQQRAQQRSSGGSDKPQTNEEKLQWLRDYMGDCQRCPLGKGRTNLVFGEGNPEARLVFVGEAPGKDEDRTGRPFVGRAGKLLDKMIAAMGLEREEVYICNVLKSRPPNNRDPRPDEIRECIPFLKKQLAIIDPEVIVTLGRPASQQLLQSDKPLGALRGRWQEYNGTAVMPTYHPAYLLRNDNQKRKVWADLQQVIERLGLSGPNR